MSCVPVESVSGRPSYLVRVGELDRWIFMIGKICPPFIEEDLGCAFRLYAIIPLLGPVKNDHVYCILALSPQSCILGEPCHELEKRLETISTVSFGPVAPIVVRGSNVLDPLIFGSLWF